MRTWERVWPCALLEVMAKARRTGNCFLFIWKGKMLSEGIFAILGMNIYFPSRDPNAIVASMMWSCRRSMTYRVPLQWPFTGSRLRNSMVMLCFLSRNMCGRIPEGHNVLKNSIGYWCSFSSTESLLLYTLTSPGNMLIIMLLMASTSLLVWQMIERDDSQAESVQLFSIPPKTKSRSSFSFCYSHVIWKFDEMMSFVFVVFLFSISNAKKEICKLWRLSS